MGGAVSEARVSTSQTPKPTIWQRCSNWCRLRRRISHCLRVIFRRRNPSVHPEEGIVKKKKKRRKKRKPTLKQRLLHKLHIVVSIFGMSIGMSNVWRFPYLCYRYGGGAFMVPYMFLLLVAGIPLVALESAIGQYSALGPGRIFREMCPMFEGLGYAMMYVLVLTAVWYNMILAWSLYYLYNAVVYDIPWGSCGNSWNTPECFNRKGVRHCRKIQLVYYNNRCMKPSAFCELFHFAPYDVTHCYDNNTELPVPIYGVVKIVSASEEYYKEYILKLGKSITDFENVDLSLMLWLAISWLLVWLLALIRFQLKGKLNYASALFPYVCMLILMVRMMFLQGSEKGLEYYLVPDFSQLIDTEVWGKAASQICFSLGPGFGGVITKASYQRFGNDFLRDTFVSALLDTGTSLVGGMMVFAIVGWMSVTSQVTVKEVVTEGTWIAFTTLPEAVTDFSFSAKLWSLLVFIFMIISLGFDTQFMCMDSILTAILDDKPELQRWRTLILLACCFVFCLCGISMTGRNGAYLFRVLDEYITGWILVFLALIENLVILWIYNRTLGSKRERFYEDFAEMAGLPPTPFWKVTWKYITPLVLMFVALFCWMDWDPIVVSDYTIPLWAMYCGHAIAASPVTVVIAFAIYHFILAKKRGKPLSSLVQPTDHWKSAKNSRKKSLVHEIELDDVLHPEFRG